MASIYFHEIKVLPQEKVAIQHLKLVLEKELSNYTGDIWIIPSINAHVATGRHDIDVLVIGKLQQPYVLDHVLYFNNIEVRSFCTTIELKSHDIDGIQQNGTVLNVLYNGEYSNVTVQSEEQKKTLKRLMEVNLQYENTRIPFITNLILISGATYADFETSTPRINIGNVLASDYTIDDFFEAIARQVNLRNNGYVDAFKNHTDEQIKSIVNIFCAKSKGADTMTLRRINLLEQGGGPLSSVEQKDDPIIVLSGHAGTGKTMMLLQSADSLSRKGKKCLFLTYNTALISDIKHSIQYMPDNRLSTVELKSMYAFFSSILLKTGIAKSTKEILNSFDKLMPLLNRRLDSFHYNIDFDYIFVDEAQDWKIAEVESLKKICNGKHIVIADGIDQFMRSELHTNWGKPQIPKLKVSLRQRCGLTQFAKLFANKLGVHWDVEPNYDIPGGKVIIVEGYEPRMHQSLLDYVKKHGCTAYDLMLLAPPSLSQDGHFAHADKYDELNIHYYDGINKNNRDKIYGEENAERDECRIYQYESCRGLESWVTVCLRFHELFSEPHPHDYHDINYDAARKYMLALWTLIPLTRPVDRLVLVVEGGSYISSILKEISKEMPDIVEYGSKKTK